MKINRDSLSYGQKIEFNSVEDAVMDALIPNAYSYDGQLEQLKVENEKLRQVLSRLIECTYGERQHERTADRLSYILGYGYEVEE